MARFSRDEGRYRVSIITGPQSVWLELKWLDERIEEFEVTARQTGGLLRNPPPDIVRARLREGSDEANREFGTSFHPGIARYAVDAYGEECFIVRRAAYAIVARLAQRGDDGYDGQS